MKQMSEFDFSYSSDEYESDIGEDLGDEVEEEGRGGEVIAKRETRTLIHLKILFVFVLIFSAAGSLGVFFYIRNKENVNFEDKFYDDATKIMASLGESLEFTVGAADAFVAGVVATARETNQTVRSQSQKAHTEKLYRV